MRFQSAFKLVIFLFLKLYLFRMGSRPPANHTYIYLEAINAYKGLIEDETPNGIFKEHDTTSWVKMITKVKEYFSLACPSTLTPYVCMECVRDTDWSPSVPYIFFLQTSDISHKIFTAWPPTSITCLFEHKIIWSEPLVTTIIYTRRMNSWEWMYTALLVEPRWSFRLT